MTHREAIEKKYKDILTVVEHQKVLDEKSKLTKFQEVVVLENQPCRLSFTRNEKTNQGKAAATISQNTKLFLAPEIVVKENSKLIITHEGRTDTYKGTGIPAVYESHQEIVLDTFERWA